MNDWLIDIELVLVYVVLLIALVFMAGSALRSFRLRDKSQNVVNNIPVTKIGYATLALLIVCLALTFLLGSSQPLALNGERYTSTFWLKAADMFIYTSLILILIAAGAVIYGMSGLSRKSGTEKKRNVQILLL